MVEPPEVSIIGRRQVVWTDGMGWEEQPRTGAWAPAAAMTIAVQTACLGRWRRENGGCDLVMVMIVTGFGGRLARFGCCR